MLRRSISALIATAPSVLLASLLAAPAAAYAQTNAGLFAKGGAADTISMWVFWLLMLLALVFLWLTLESYATGFEGAKRIRRGHRMLLYMILSVAVAVLVRFIVFIVQQ